MRNYKKPTPAWVSFVAGLLVLVLTVQFFSGIGVELAQGAYTTSTTDADGVAHLGSNVTNDTFYYDTTKDSDPATQQQLGVDPNWRQGITRKSYALKLDGTNDYANVPYSASLNITKTITLEAWVKTTATTRSDILTRYVNSGGYAGYGLSVSPSGCSTGAVGMWVGGSAWRCSTATINDGAWHHVAATYDSTTIRMYIDGVASGSAAETNGLNETVTALKIGVNPGNTDPFNGTLDEVRVSDTIRYVSGFSPLRRYLEDTNTKGLWHFDEGEGQAVGDASQFNNDGTLGANSGSASDDPTWVTSANAIMDGFDSSKTTSGNRTGAGNISLGESSSVSNDKNYDIRITNSNGLTFDGSADLVKAYNSVAPPTGAQTYEAWIKTSTTNGGVLNFSNATPSDGTFDRRLAVIGTYGTFYISNGTPFTATGTTAINDGQWHHLAGVVLSTNVIQLYVDGRLEAQTSTTHTGYAGYATPRLNIGHTGTTGYFTGQIDEIRISSTTRYSSTFTPSRRFSTDGSTLALFHFDEGTGQTLADMSGNGYDGTLGADSGSASDDPSWDEGIGASQNSYSSPPTQTAGNQVANSSAAWALPGYDKRQRLSVATTTAVGAGHGTETSIDRSTLMNNKQMRSDGKDTRIVYQPSDQYRSLSFDNSNDFVTVPTPANINSISSNLTLEATVKLTAYGASAAVDNIMSNDKIYFNLGDSGKPAVYLLGVSNPGWHTATNAIPLNTWVHLAVTYNGSSVKIYQDGIEVYTSSITGSITASTTSLLIGKRSDDADSFTGYIDEVRISNTVRYTGSFTPQRVPFVADTSTQGLWHFDEGSGQIVSDSSSNQVHGHLGSTSGAESSDPTRYTTDGVITTTQEVPRFIPHGNSLTFDGSNDVVKVPSWGTVITQPFTWEAWVYPTTGGSGNYDMILRFQVGAGNSQAGLWYDPANQKFVYGTIGYYTGTSSTSYAPGNWYHVAGTHENNQGSLYVNGVLQATFSSPTGVENSGATALQIGNDTTNQGFLGIIDEVRLSNVVRYKNNFTPSTNPFSRDANTIALYHLDEGTGQTITDSSSNSYNGTLGADSGSAPDDPDWITNGGYVDSTNRTQFKTVAPIGASTTDKDYYLYYGNANESGSALSYASYSLLFDGTNDYVVTSSQSASGLTGLSYSFWIKTTASSGVPISWADYRFCQIGVTANKLTCTVDGNTTGAATSTTTINDGNWHFVVFTSTASAQSLYVDNTSGTAEATTSETLNTANSGVIRMGSTTAGATFFNGTLDDVRIYTRALTSGASGEAVGLRSNTPIVSNSNLVNVWKLDTTTAGSTTATDSGSAGATGTLTSFDFNALSNWQVNTNLLDVATEPVISSLITETESPVFFQYRDNAWSGGAISSSAWSTRSVITPSETQLGSTGVYIKFNPMGLYSRHDYYRITSWAIEAFSSSAPARGKSNVFPEKANIVGDNAGVTIIDASNNKVWMRFANSYTSMIDGNGGSGSDYVVAKDGQIFVAAGAYVPVGMISFDRDSAQNFEDSGNSNYQGFIADRNDALSYAAQSGAAVTHNTRGKMSVQVINNKMYLASSGGAGINVIHNATSFEPNSRTGTILRYGTDTWHTYTDTELTTGGALYATNLSSSPDTLERWNSIQNDTSDQVAAADRTWTTSSTPALRSADINDISVTSGTSTADNGTSDTIAIAHASGVDVIQDHSTQSSGTIRYYARQGTPGSSGWSANRFAGAAQFDGTNDHIYTGSNFSLGTSNVTLETWVRLDSASTRGAFIKVGGNNGYAIGVGTSSYDNNGNNLIGLYEGIAWINTNVTIGTGWHHVAMVITTSGVAKFFIDGTLVFTSSSSSITTPAATTYIGGYDSTGFGGLTRYCTCVLDEVRLSSSARYSATFTPSTSPFTPDATTAALYHLDERTGQSIYDHSTSSTTATLGANSSVASDDPLLISPTITGSSDKATSVGLIKNNIPGNTLSFDGGDKVAVPHVSSYDPAAAGFSISMYTKSSAAAAWSVIIGNGSASSWYLQVSGTKLYAYFPSLSGALTSNATVFNDSIWHHVAVTWDGTKFQMYVDGALDTSSSPTGSAAGTSLPLTIGSLGSSAYFTGNLSDVKLFNRGLSGSDINNLFHGDDRLTSGLVGAFKLNEGAGQIIKDASTLANNGTLGADNNSASDDPTWTTGAPVKNKVLMWVGTNGSGANDGALTAIELSSEEVSKSFSSATNGLPDIDITSLSTGEGGLALVGTEAGAWNPGMAGLVILDTATTVATTTNPIRIKSGGTTRFKSGGTIRLSGQSY